MHISRFLNIYILKYLYFPTNLITNSHYIPIFTKRNIYVSTITYLLTSYEHRFRSKLYNGKNVPETRVLDTISLRKNHPRQTSQAFSRTPNGNEFDVPNIHAKRVPQNAGKRTAAQDTKDIKTCISRVRKTVRRVVFVFSSHPYTCTNADASIESEK